jgi:hypothetical protein
MSFDENYGSIKEDQVKEKPPVNSPGLSNGNKNNKLSRKTRILAIVYIRKKLRCRYR